MINRYLVKKKRKKKKTMIQEYFLQKNIILRRHIERFPHWKIERPHNIVIKIYEIEPHIYLIIFTCCFLCFLVYFLEVFFKNQT